MRERQNAKSLFNGKIWPFKDVMSTKQICWTVWRESRRVKNSCSQFDVQKAELKKYIIERTGFREKRKEVNFTVGHNENLKEMRHKSKIAEKDFFRDVDVADRQVETFTESSLSFLCGLKNEITKGRCYTEKIKRKQKNKLACERGITLLALIITVVIMIILAAVTINVTLGDGGLVDQAKWAAEHTANATKSEGEQLDDVASQINDIIAGIGSGGSDTNSTGGEDTNSVETNSMDTNSVEETNSIDTNSVWETNTVDTNTIDPDPVPDPLPDGTITIGEPQWQDDGTANVTVETTEPDVTIEYQIGGTDEGRWIPVEGGTIEGIKNGETVYVRITDGEQYSNPQNKKI